MKSNSQTALGCPEPQTIPSLPDFHTTPNAKREKEEAGKINKSWILMTHFRGTLYLSLGPDIREKANPQSPSSIKSSLSRNKSQEYV